MGPNYNIGGPATQHISTTWGPSGMQAVQPTQPAAWRPTPPPPQKSMRENVLQAWMQSQQAANDMNMQRFQEGRQLLGQYGLGRNPGPPTSMLDPRYAARPAPPPQTLYGAYASPAPPPQTLYGAYANG